MKSKNLIVLCILVVLFVPSVLAGPLPAAIAANIPTVTSVTCTPNSLAFTSWTKCTAVVSGSSPSGTVTFSDSDLNFTSNTGTFDSTMCTLSDGSCSVFFTFTATGCLIYCQENDFQITGDYGGDSNNLPSSGSDPMLRFHSCWFAECLYNTSPGGDYTDYFCVVGNNPTDAFADCKAADTDYASTGYDLSNQGIELPGAGTLSSMLPACVGTLNAINTVTSDLGYAAGSSPGQVDSAALLSTCALGYPLYKTGADLSASFGGKPVPDEGLMDTLYPLVLSSSPAGWNEIGLLAVYVDLACGFVNYYCYGANITAEMIANPFNIQNKPNPMTLSDWGDHNSGNAIGWSLPSCTDKTFCTNVSSLCGPNGTNPPCINPASQGTAGRFDTLDISHPDYSQINTNAPIECTTGHVNDLSIGYDGDADFNVNSSSVAPLVNPSNEQGGSLGPPNGIVAEIPPADRASTNITPDGQPLYQTLEKMKVGMEVHICGRWVTDTRDLWNELHPITSLEILPDFSVSASPTNITILSGGKASFTTNVTLLSGPSGATPVQLSILGLPTGASPIFSTNPIPLDNPSTMTGSSTIQITTASSVALGDYPLTIKATDQSGLVVETASVDLHVYDFGIASPSPLQVLETGANTYNISANLVAGSSTFGLPTIALNYSTLPAGVSMSFSPSSSIPNFTSVLGITAASAMNGTYLITLTGTDSRPDAGGTRTDAVTLSVLSPQQAIQFIIAQINAFKSGGVLTAGQANSLISKLNAATSNLNVKPPDHPAACNELNSFVNQVNSYVAHNVLTQAQANLLLAGPLGMQAIMVSIPC